MYSALPYQAVAQKTCDEPVINREQQNEVFPTRYSRNDASSKMGNSTLTFGLDFFGTALCRTFLDLFCVGYGVSSIGAEFW